MSGPGPDKELINSAFRIKPVVADHDGNLFFTEPLDLYEQIYTMESVMNAGPASNLQKIGEVDVLMHATLWGGSVSSPTCADVLKCIPPELRDKVVAFQAHMPKGDTRGDNGYVLAKADIYAGELPEHIRQQPVRAWHRDYTKPFPEAPIPKEQFNAAAATTLDEDVEVMKPLNLKKPPAP